MRRAFVQLHVCGATHHARRGEAKPANFPAIRLAIEGDRGRLKPILKSTAQLLCVAQKLCEPQI